MIPFPNGSSANGRRRPGEGAAEIGQSRRGSGRTLFLVSLSRTPCGVEMFARRLLESCRATGIEGRFHALSGALRELGELRRATTGIGSLVVSIPVVAWKRALFAPAAAMIMARLRGARTIVVLHEWADLDWRRRIVVAGYLLFARTILFSSPLVRAQFARTLVGRLPFKTGLVPIPPNVRRPPQLPSTPLARRLEEEKAKKRLILGHFGSIYPKKRSSFVLDVAAALRRMQIDVFVVFIGSFIAGSRDVESEFYARAAALGLADDILVTGYIEAEAEIFALFERVDAFVYSFAEGLSSRRGSVLACLQSGRRVFVNSPVLPGEFDHHPAFRKALAGGQLRLAPTEASAQDFADAIMASDWRPSSEPFEFFHESWRDAVGAIAATLGAR
jgi:glycosyltransferase involved in cell wall biosynthesis